jgi:hypothetical protein
VIILSLRDLYSNPSESIWIEYFVIFGLTNWIQDTNLLKKGSTNRIHNTNLLKTGIQNESTNWIFWTGYGYGNLKHRIRTCSKYVYVLRFVRICDDSLDSWKHIKALKIGWIHDVQHEMNLSKSWFVKHNARQIQDS